MDQAPQPTDQKNETAQAKNEYHTPEVREYGTVADLTRTNSAPIIITDSGVSFPNVYVTAI